MGGRMVKETLAGVMLITPSALIALTEKRYSPDERLAKLTERPPVGALQSASEPSSLYW